MLQPVSPLVLRFEAVVVALTEYHMQLGDYRLIKRTPAVGELLAAHYPSRFRVSCERVCVISDPDLSHIVRVLYVATLKQRKSSVTSSGTRTLNDL
ncbi:unnamed protein product [Strongylus vulgaris]|uniref:Uncharacterized protein n=1 Tax=Strongylus vulgaris TaxID=40348 RepID=A0A3P7I858_STRVU|nr:unnamed protein product [Strongylus vulgaris]